MTQEASRMAFGDLAADMGKELPQKLHFEYFGACKLQVSSLRGLGSWARWRTAETAAGRNAAPPVAKPSAKLALKRVFGTLCGQTCASALLACSVIRVVTLRIPTQNPIRVVTLIAPSPKPDQGCDPDRPDPEFHQGRGPDHAKPQSQSGSRP